MVRTAPTRVRRQRRAAGPTRPTDGPAPGPVDGQGGFAVKNRVPFTGRARGGRRPAHPAAGRLPALAALAAAVLSGAAAFAQSPAAPEVVPAYAKAILDGSVT